ncbi:MAG: TolC family protein, partial [Myxococcales bacterium]|nr:TolC family protein [Myxococcales bacterium]
MKPATTLPRTSLSLLLRPVNGWLRAATLVAVVLVAGCVPSLEDNPPRDAHKGLPASFGRLGGKPTAHSDAGQAWGQLFADPHLEALIEMALDSNQELHMRLQEIIIAKNEIMARKGEYLPKVDVGLRGGVEKVGKYTSQGQADEHTGTPENLPDLGFGFSATWEIDIWKKLRNAARAATFRYLATIEGRKFAVTRLVAEIASSYYELLALDNQLEVLDRNITIQQNALEVVRIQKQAARVTQLAVQRFEAEVLKNQSRKYALQQQIIQIENHINFLVGRFPQHIVRSSDSFDDPLPPPLQAGLPSELLENRPDVKQAELMLEAAKLDVKVAKARFYPSFSIDADVGFEAFNPRHIVDTPDSLFYNLAGNLTAPLLNRQGIKAQYFAANAMQLQAVYAYEQTVLGAFTEVKNQLALIENLEKSYELQEKQVQQLTDAIEVSNLLFRSARADYMEV